MQLKINRIKEITDFGLKKNSCTISGSDRKKGGGGGGCVCRARKKKMRHLDKKKVRCVGKRKRKRKGKVVFIGYYMRNIWFWKPI